MKYTCIYILFLSIYFSCAENAMEVKRTIAIHFQEGFNNDHVKVIFHNNDVFSKIIKTESQSGFADEVSLFVSNNDSCIITVNQDSLYYKFNSDCSFLRVTYSNVTSILIECNNGPFLYD